MSNISTFKRHSHLNCSTLSSSYVYAKCSIFKCSSSKYLLSIYSTLVLFKMILKIPYFVFLYTNFTYKIFLFWATLKSVSTHDNTLKHFLIFKTIQTVSISFPGIPHIHNVSYQNVLFLSSLKFSSSLNVPLQKYPTRAVFKMSLSTKTIAYTPISLFTIVFHSKVTELELVCLFLFFTGVWRFQEK